ncbi:uncharacterized protein Tco025E_04073 [Trypanosoma conorhini]|uniref:Uncharacterized protein n=1 Tax=Trypanosoma conorhini TaxID=83891 RepID=A0A422PP95_9TRYP|nr:uncharacterized protein Tco025E_04073 [Trypanosoma conorhini]RNF19565.1 hypothetical protein Tco025E_04073 [Trypanosoma conorhini]
MQSLWSMYVTVKSFESNTERAAVDIVMARTLRRAFRRNRTLSRLAFLRHKTFNEAVRFQHNIFSLGTGHYDLLNRIRGHFAEKRPNKLFRTSVLPISGA